MFAFFHGADVTGRKRATVHAVIGRAVEDFQAAGVQMAHAPMPKVCFGIQGKSNVHVYINKPKPTFGIVTWIT